MDKNKFLKILQAKVAQKKDSSKNRTLEFLGSLGLIGWSVVTPTVLGAMFGHWLDLSCPASISWTLTFLIFGLIGGCAAAWQWITKESSTIEDKK